MKEITVNLLQKIEKQNIEKALESSPIPDFRAGDNLKVHVKIVDGATERVQVYEGLCIRKKNRGMGSSFTVKKVSNGEGMERHFLLYSPRISKIEVVRRGVVRRAKLYYMRKLQGKAARIKEKVSYKKKSSKAA